ncbi:MAG TPA: restriction endonuclease subunit S [Ktedonobacteraceae bacterium]|nr:restriction endonuclease subunit S [Ktedonobacteraceae bacterium]
MSGHFPKVPLGDVLQYRGSDFIEIDDFQVYKRCRVQLHAQGVIERDAVLGAEIKTKKQQVCRAKEFLVAEIDAKLGGFGIVPESLDGAIVSSHYFLFAVKEEVLNRRFLEFFIRTPTFLDQVQAKGSTNYAAIRPSDVLKYEIPLPSLEEQLHIVARIEELHSKVVDGKRENELAQEVLNQLKFAYVESAIPTLTKDHESVKFGSLIKRSRHLEPLLPEVTYQGIGTKMWGQGAYVHEIKNGSEFNAERYSVANGQLIYNEVWAHNGAIAVILGIDGKTVVSRHFHVFDVDWGELSPQFLTWIFRSPWFWNKCQDGSVGTSGRVHMRRQHLENISLPIPPLEEQYHIIAYLDDLQAKLESLKLLQAQATAELDAMLPSILDKAFKGEL